MVSKASDDLPEPESPVITTSRSRGMSRSTFFRLCSRAPRIEITRASGLRGSFLLRGAIMSRLLQGGGREPPNVVGGGRGRQLGAGAPRRYPPAAPIRRIDLAAR